MSIILTPNRLALIEDKVVTSNELRYSDHLCFIETEHQYWTPALTFDNCGTMLTALHATLTPLQRRDLALQVFATNNNVPMAKLLENGSFVVVDNNKVRPFYLSLQEVWQFNTVEQLGITLYQQWKQGMNQVDILLSNECNAAPTKWDCEQEKEKTKPTRIWGRDPQQALPPAVKANKKTKKAATIKKEIPAKKAICFSNKVTTFKTVSKQKQNAKKSTVETKPPRSPVDNFYVWTNVWQILKHRGWTYQIAKCRLHSWCWMKPECKSQTEGVVGTDMFFSETDVLKYCKQIDFKSQVEREQQETNSPPLMTPKDAMTKPQDPSAPLLLTIHEDSPSPDQFAWNVLWPRLLRLGWTFKSAAKYHPLHDIYYVKPNINPATGVLGKDFFLTAADVIQYERDMKQGLLTFNDTPPTVNYRRITLSPPRRMVIKKKSQKQMKKEWFHGEDLPSFLKVWAQILRVQLKFNYINGSYTLPDGSMSFRSDKELRLYLVQNGIPNLENLTNPVDKTILLRWITFCHVPVKDTTSRVKLQHVQVLDDETAMSLLSQLGMSRTNDQIYWLRHAKCGATVSEVRNYVRATQDLDEGGRRRASSTTLQEDEWLNLRVWAAMSSDDLPTHGLLK